MKGRAIFNAFAFPLDLVPKGHKVNFREQLLKGFGFHFVSPSGVPNHIRVEEIGNDVDPCGTKFLAMWFREHRILELKAVDIVLVMGLGSQHHTYKALFFLIDRCVREDNAWMTQKASVWWKPKFDLNDLPLKNGHRNY
jgi:hypothetical protein